jgi:hypothetical protein
MSVALWMSSGDLRFIAPVQPRYDIMGPFRCVPFMECRHSVFSLYHTSAACCAERPGHQFDGGTGYIEGTGVVRSRSAIYGHSAVLKTAR